MNALAGRWLLRLLMPPTWTLPNCKQRVDVS
jgi:hypothetical protein